MIDNKFLYFLTYADFETKLTHGQIDENSIVFVADKSMIWTHGKDFMKNSDVYESINKIFDKLDEITGETSRQLNMTVSPEYFVGEEGCDVQISIGSIDSDTTFESIKFYFNGVLDAEHQYKDVKNVEPFTVHIDSTTTIRCEAIILGEYYEQQKTIVNHPAFWIGTGANYTSVMNDRNNLVDISKGIRTTKDVTFGVEGKLYVIMDASIASEFIRIDMNGFEIMLDEPIAIPDTSYTYCTSQNTFQVGTYNIDING